MMQYKVVTYQGTSINDFRGGGRSKMTPKNRTLKVNFGHWGAGNGGQKISPKNRTSFMNVPLRYGTRLPLFCCVI